MEIEIFTLCDFAQEALGKLTLLGSFDNIAVTKVPFVYSHCSITAKLRFSEKEAGKHKGSITLKNPKGDLIIPALDFEPNVVIPAGGDYAVVNVVLNLQNFQFNEYGKHRIELAIDGDWKAGLTLRVGNPGLAA